MAVVEYEDLKPLIYANYVTDRLLSGDFDLDSLETRYNDELEASGRRVGTGSVMN